MRQLKTTDLFAGLRVIKAVGVKEEMKQFAMSLANGQVKADGKVIKKREPVSEQAQRELGTELLLGILANCGTEAAETAFFEFVAGPLEIPVPELRDMELLKFAEKIRELVGFIDVEAWKSFFTSLGELLKKMR